MQNQILGFFIITTIAFAGLSAVQWKRSVHYREQVAVVQQEAFEEAHQAGMREAEVRSLERRVKQRDEDTAALTEMVQSLMASTNELTVALTQARASSLALTESPSPEPGTNATAPLRMLGKMMENPAMREMMLAQQKMMFETMYGALLKNLNLNDEQISAFQELILDSQMSAAEFGASAMPGRTADPSTDPLKALEIRRSQEMQDGILVNQQEANQRVLQRAQSFLSPEQLVSLAGFYENQLKMMNMGMEMSKLMAGESSEPPPTTAGSSAPAPAPAPAVPH